MGRLYIELDPEGYDRLEEQGFAKRWTGAELYKELSPPESAGGPGRFWNPEGSEWLMPSPRQFRADWYKDALLQDSLIRRADWTFAAGITAIDEYDRTHTPGAAGSDWYWTQFYVPALAGVTSLDPRSYSAMGAKTLFSLPSMKTVAKMTVAPNGDALGSGLIDFHPWFGWVQYPRPHDLIAFGWGDFAFLATDRTWYLLRTPNNDGLTWERLAQGTMGGQIATSALIPAAAETAGGGVTEDITPVQRAFMCCPVGDTDLWFSIEGGGARYSKLIPDVVPAGSGPMFKSGHWWIASPGEQKVDAMVQVVAYDSARTADFTEAPGLFWDLGPSYRPTQEPLLLVGTLMHDFDGGGEPIERSDTANEATYTRPAAESVNEKIVVGIKDADNNAWVSDGTNHQGKLKITLEPDSFRFSEYVAPAINFVSVVFPELRTARARSGLILDDTKWAALNCATSLRDPSGKRVEFIVHDKTGELVDANFHKRFLYPVHILEDTDDDDVGDLIIARAWVWGVQLREIKQEGASGDPLRFYSFHCRGLMSRMDEGWLHPPVIVNPESEAIEHDYAIKEAFRQAGFDPTDTDLFDFYADPYAGTSVAQLPQGLAFAGLVNDGSAQPDWSEPKHRYCERVATEWRGWVPPYETDAQIRYHPDLLNAVRLGTPFFAEATLHQTTAAAVAAGTPLFAMLASPAPEAETLPADFYNAVRISGKDPSEPGANPNRSRHVIDKDEASVSDITADNFIGDLRVYGAVSKMGVSTGALQQLARVMRLKRSRRRTPWAVTAPFAPHQLDEVLCEVGRVWVLDGRAPILIENLEWTILGPSVNAGVYTARTRMTGPELHPDAVEGVVSGDYPGEGVSA